MKSMRLFLANLLCLVVGLLLLSSCNRSKLANKDHGPHVAPTIGNKAEEEASKIFFTRPGEVLLTAHPQHRLVPIYQELKDHRRGHYYISTNSYHSSHNISYNEYRHASGSFSSNYMPGLSAMHGHRLLNVAHYSPDSADSQLFFESHVLINTLYFPALAHDTIRGKVVTRNYYLVSVYDQDTNQDSLINRQDLRHFYRFDLTGLDKAQLVPANYSVLSSQYDPSNDQMLIYARLDENNNGQQELEESVHIFALPLKTPQPAIKVY